MNDKRSFVILISLTFVLLFPVGACTRKEITDNPATSGPQAKQISLDSNKSQVNALAFSPDGKLLAGATEGQFIKVWNAQTGDLLKTIKVEGVQVLNALSFSPDGKMLAAAAGFVFGVIGGELKLWDTQAWEPKTGTGHWLDLLANSVTFSPDSKLVASGNRDGSVSFWEVGKTNKAKTLKALKGPVSFVAFLPGGVLLASGSSGKVLIKPVPDKPGTGTTQMPGEVVLLDVATGKIKRTLSTNDNDKARYRVAFSQDGKMLAVRGADDAVELWDAQTGQVTKSFKGQKGTVKTVAISPDGRMLASGGEDKTIMLWSIETGQLTSSLAGHEGPVTSLVFAPDGSTLASASADKTARLWQLK